MTGLRRTGMRSNARHIERPAIALFLVIRRCSSGHAAMPNYLMEFTMTASKLQLCAVVPRMFDLVHSLQRGTSSYDI